MKTQNLSGCIAVALFVAAILLYFLPDDTGVWAKLSIALQLVAFGLGLYAGLRGSRWWLLHTAGYLLFVGYWVWLLSQGH